MKKLTFFFDRNIGKRLPESLRHLDPPFEVRWHKGERFAHDMPDDEWLSIVGEKGWIVVSQDWKYHVNAAERRAIQQHGIKCFYIPGSGDTKWLSFCRMINSHQKLMKIATDTPAPFIYDLKSNGRLVPVSLSQL